VRKFVFNPITGEMDQVFNVPESVSDPASLAPGDLWVTSPLPGGKIKTFLGLGFPVTSPDTGVYKLKFRTNNNTTIYWNGTAES